ncbi:homeobox-domain-containing protein [Fistulina hepatica ATCC 64428]|uniref:Homeobox-domain-containing protein n=1 Tax=Fistulina hepatica ATCC 64428 TaxID=1128425 RepID=A0A0D7A673_9AGAR|nr:homeobox-domain-containing protein [Fistulina hepatica ATCC 64428]
MSARKPRTDFDDQLDARLSAPSAAPAKKPRHRHSPAQIAALNELYEKNDHPELKARTELAEQIGMQVKTVNAWFQNKRASSKKRSMLRQTVNTPDAASASSAHRLAREISPASTVNTAPLDDDDYQQHPDPSSRPAPAAASSPSSGPSSAPVKRTRNRLTAVQTETLKNVFAVDQNPNRQLREDLAERIGMSEEAVQTWFSNHKARAKKRESRQATPLTAPPINLPPPTQHPSLPPQSGFAQPPRHLDELLPLDFDNLSPSPHVIRSPGHRVKRSASPYPTPRRNDDRRARSANQPSLTDVRPRRSRPEPYQLSALKALFTQTQRPSPDQRMRLAREIGMEASRVNNWFRNARAQRKRARATTTSAGAMRRSSDDSVSDEDIDMLMQDEEDIDMHDTESISDEEEDGEMGNERDDNVDGTEQMFAYPTPPDVAERYGMDNAPRPPSPTLAPFWPRARLRSQFGSPLGFQLPPAAFPAEMPYSSSPVYDPRVSYDGQTPYEVKNSAMLDDMDTYTNTTAKGSRIEDALLLLNFTRGSAVYVHW